MRNALVAVFACLILTGMACGGPAKGIPRYRTEGPAAQDFLVTIWVQPDNDLTRAEMQKGCDVWLPKGVRCVFVDSKLGSMVRVRADHRDCEKKADGTYTLAWAYEGGDIVMLVECMKKGDDKKIDLHQLFAVFGHELGHEFGVWEHVPEKCDDSAKTHPNGRKVCGQAIMNPYYEKDVHFMTPIDALAFDLRDPFSSVLVSDVPPNPVPSCVYLGR